jgi:hypothetical protein
MANRQETDSPKVFISYAWKNQPIAKQLQRDLQRDGVEVFVDYEKITGGDSLPARISAALEWCNTLVLLWSAEAAKSYYVSQEWETAFHLQKRIIPGVLDGTALPAVLRRLLYLNFSSYETGYAQLCRTLGVESTAAKTPTAERSNVPATAPKPPRAGNGERKSKPGASRMKSIFPVMVIKPKHVNPATFVKEKWTTVKSAAPSWWQRERGMILTLGLIVVAVIFLGVQLLCQ